MARLTHLFLFLCLVGSIQAQSSLGTIDGILLDVGGNPASGVDIEIENIRTNQNHSATTDTSGKFRFEALPVGEYRVVSELGQSAPVVFDARGDRTVRIELRTMAGGSPTERASAEVIPIQTETGQIGETFGNNSIELLPQPNYAPRAESLNGAYNQSLLSEAVTAPNPIQNANGPIVAGVDPVSNNFNIDGTDNNNRANPGPLVYVSNEVTRDFVLNQNSFSPRFGHSAGGQLNSIISTGANQVHGSAYWYLQNRELNAMSPATAA